MSLRTSWQPDSERKTCNKCERKFELLFRRHHCRICGLIFCDDCTKFRVKRAKVKGEGDRSCEACWNSLKQKVGGTTTTTTTTTNTPTKPSDAPNTNDAKPIVMTALPDSPTIETKPATTVEASTTAEFVVQTLILNDLKECTCLLEPPLKKQIWFNCYTCDMVDSEENPAFGMCFVCAETCHAGHDLSVARLLGGFICDCGLVPTRCICNRELPKSEAAVEPKPKKAHRHSLPAVKITRDGVKKGYNTGLFMKAISGNFSEETELDLSNPEATNVLSEDREHPFDVALRSRSGGNFILALLGRKTKLETVNEAARESDPEGFYSKCLLRAKKQLVVEEQIYYLLKLSAFYLTKAEKESTAERKLPLILVSAKLHNSVFPLVSPDIKYFEVFENYLYFKLNEIERAYYIAIGVAAPNIPASSNKKNRKRLAEIRKYGAAGLETTDKRFQGYVRMIFEWGKERMQKELASRSKDAEKLWPFFQWAFKDVLKSDVVFEMSWHWETLGNMIKMSGTQPQSMIDFFNLDWKEIVHNAREEEIEIREPAKDVLYVMTLNFKTLLSDIINESIAILGPAPCEWVALGMGSMSRDEMCPYSDIEFAFALSVATEKSLNYFRDLSRIIEMKIVNVGETPFPVFGADKSPCSDGFCMDSGGNTPLGVTGVYELIGTPQQLAQFQSVKWMQRNIILPNALSNVCYIAGNKYLKTQYDLEKKKIQSEIAFPNKQQDVKLKNFEELVARLLKGHLVEFRPDLSKKKERQSVFGVKKELYRPFQEVLSCLALKFNLKTRNSFDRIDELRVRGVFSEEGANNLKIAVNAVLLLRLKAHFFYNDEQEYLCFPQEGIKQDPALCYFNEEMLENLRQIYVALIPFHEAAVEFLNTGQESSLRGSFDTQNPLLSARACVGAGLHEQALEHFQKAVSLNPNDFDASIEYGALLRDLGMHEQALQRAHHVYNLVKKQFQSHHINNWKIMNFLSDCYESTRQGDSFEAVEIQKKLLQHAEEQMLDACEKEGGEALATLLLLIAQLNAKFGNMTNVISMQERLMQLVGASEAITSAKSEPATDERDETEGNKQQPESEKSTNAVISPSLLCQIYKFLAYFNQETLKDPNLALQYQLKAMELCLESPDCLREFFGVASRLIRIFNELEQHGNTLNLIQRDAFQLKFSRAIIELGEIDKSTLAEFYDNVALSYAGKGINDLEKYQEFMTKSKAIYLSDSENTLALMLKYKKMGDLFKSKKLYDSANENYQHAIDIVSPPSQGEVKLPEHKKASFGGDFITTIFEMAETLVLTNNIDKCLRFSLVGLETALRMQSVSETELYVVPRHVQFAKQILARNLELHLKLLPNLIEQENKERAVIEKSSGLVRRCHFNIAMLHFHLNSYRLALASYQSCLELLGEKEKETLFAVQLLKEIGRNHDLLESPANALASYEKGLVSIERLVKEKSNVAERNAACQNELTQYLLLIARYYHNEKNYTQAADYFQRALKSHTQAGNSSDLNRYKVKTIYCYLVDCYSKAAVKNWDRAIEYEKLILEIEIEDAPQRNLDPSVATCYQIISKFYGEKQDFERAIEYYAKYAEVDLKAHSNSKLWHEKAIARLYGKAGLFQQQIDTCTKNMTGLDETSAQFSEWCEFASEGYVGLKDYVTALESVQKAIRASSSGRNGENTEHVANLYAKCAAISEMMGDSAKAEEFRQTSQARRDAIVDVPLNLTPMTDKTTGPKLSDALALKTPTPKPDAPFLSPMPDSATLAAPKSKSSITLSPMPDSATMSAPKSSITLSPIPDSATMSAPKSSITLSPIPDSAPLSALSPIPSAPKSILTSVAGSDLFLCLSDDVFRMLLDSFPYDVLKIAPQLNTRFARFGAEVFNTKPVVLTNGFYQLKGKSPQLVRFYPDHYAMGVSLGVPEFNDTVYRQIFSWFKRPFDGGNGTWLAHRPPEMGKVSWSNTSQSGTVKYAATSVEFGKRLCGTVHSFINGRVAEVEFEFHEYDFEANAKILAKEAEDAVKNDD